MEHYWESLEYTREMIPRMARLALEYYGEQDDISKENYLEYEYLDNPYGEAFINVAINKETSEIYGQYAVMPRAVHMNEMEYPCVMSGNTLTSKNHYGEGIFTALARDVYSRVEAGGKALAYGMPNQNSHPGFIGHLGFSDIGRIPLLLRPIDIKKLGREYTGSAVISGLLSPLSSYFGISNKNATSNNYDIEVKDLDYEALEIMDRFWEKAKSKYPIMISRDSKYIKHRYLDNPERRYILRLAIKEGEPIGFIAARNMKVSGMSCGMIADYLLLDDGDKVGGILLDSVAIDLKSAGANLLGCLMLPHSREYQVLKKNRFIKCPSFAEPQPFSLIVRLFEKNYKGAVDPLDINNWFFTMGDYDVV